MVRSRWQNDMPWLALQGTLPDHKSESNPGESAVATPHRLTMPCPMNARDHTHAHAYSMPILETRPRQHRPQTPKCNNILPSN